MEEEKKEGKILMWEEEVLSAHEKSWLAVSHISLEEKKSTGEMVGQRNRWRRKSRTQKERERETPSSSVLILPAKMLLLLSFLLGVLNFKRKKNP